jgi:hypothetical protein
MCERSWTSSTTPGSPGRTSSASSPGTAAHRVSPPDAGPRPFGAPLGLIPASFAATGDTRARRKRGLTRRLSPVFSALSAPSSVGAMGGVRRSQVALREHLSRRARSTSPVLSGAIPAAGADRDFGCQLRDQRKPDAGACAVGSRQHAESGIAHVDGQVAVGLASFELYLAGDRGGLARRIRRRW